MGDGLHYRDLMSLASIEMSVAAITSRSASDTCAFSIIVNIYECDDGVGVLGGGG